MTQPPVDRSTAAQRDEQFVPLATGLRVHAPAKINLNLLVAPRGEDGYHPIDSIVTRIALYDEIDLLPRRDAALRLTCPGADCGADEQNLALRAARLLAEGREVGGVDITLTKRIAAGRGLGGGSSDAAAVLAGLRALWGLNVNDDELSSLGGELGSDVPLFLGPPAARMTGRGEKLQRVAVHSLVAVVISPDFMCATADVYRAFDDAPPPMGEQIDMRLFAKPPSQWRGLLVNQLTERRGLGK